MYQDSTGKPIKVGDRVRFRGQVYTIERFVPGEGSLDTARIVFVESQAQHTDEPADEISVDLVAA